MMTGTYNQNVGKLFSELKLVPNNHLFIYAEANWEATERVIWSSNTGLSDSYSHTLITQYIEQSLFAA